MATLSPDVTAALASLQARWGAAAPQVVGSLAIAPSVDPVDPRAAPDPAEAPGPLPSPDPTRGVLSTGFAGLDRVLGLGGLPRATSVAIRGDGSSGGTTVALRTVAEAQAAGSVVAWLDLARSLDPIEAAARGVRLEWLVVVTPETLDEGLAIAGGLLSGRSVDLLVLDLPVSAPSASPAAAPADRPVRVAERLHRLAALARRTGTTFLILEPPGLDRRLAGAVAESTGLRLELARRSWIRLGRDIVGQRTEARVVRDRHGPPGRRATLRILYAEGGARDRCLRRDDLLIEAVPTVDQAPAIELERTDRDATPPAPPTASPPRAGDGPHLRALPDRAAGPGRSPVGSGTRPRRRPRGAGPGGPTRDAAGERASTGA